MMYFHTNACVCTCLYNMHVFLYAVLELPNVAREKDKVKR